MPVANVGGVKLNYTLHGSGDWLVLIGGYASGNWQSWGAHLTELAKRYRVLAFDNRGIGDSDAPAGPYSTQIMARDTLGLMDHLGIEQAHVFGKALGGCIAQWVALEQPSRVRSLALTSTMAQPNHRLAKMIRWWMASARDAGFSTFFPGLLTYFYTDEYYQANREEIERTETALISVRRSLEGFLNTGHAAVTHNTWDRLTEISAPTLLMCGGEDIITPPRHAEEMGRRLRDAEVHIIPQTLQGVLTEKPESFELVLDFLARH